MHCNNSLGHTHAYHAQTQGIGGHHPYVFPAPLAPIRHPTHSTTSSAVAVVSPRMGDDGWPFAVADEFPGADKDPHYNSQHVKDLYLRADPDFSGRCVVLVLVARTAY